MSLKDDLEEVLAVLNRRRATKVVISEEFFQRLKDGADPLKHYDPKMSVFFGLPFEVDANQIEPFKIELPDGSHVTQEGIRNSALAFPRAKLQ